MNLSAQTPRRQGASVRPASCTGRPLAAWRLRTPLATWPPFSILCEDAYAPPTAPWTDATPRTRLPATGAGRRETGASQGGAAQAIPQAAGLARARPAPPAAAGSRVAGHHPGVRDPRSHLLPLHRADGRDRTDLGHGGHDRVRSPQLDRGVVRNVAGRRGHERGARIWAQPARRIPVRGPDRRAGAVLRGATQPRAGVEGRGLRQHSLLARGHRGAVPEALVDRRGVRALQRAAARPRTAEIGRAHV